MRKTQTYVFLGLLIALEIILTRFLSIQTPFLRIGFGFLPIALVGIMYGPWVAGGAAVVADLLGMLIFPKGAFFPGFTASAFIGGAIYGLLLYKKPKSMLRIGIAVLLITVLVDLGLNSVWLSILYHKAVIALIVPRIVKSTIMLPIQTAVIYIVWRYVGAQIQIQFISEA